MKELINKIGFSLWSCLLFISGMLLYSKILDKPEVEIKNEYRKIKNKGENSDISTSSNTDIIQRDNSAKSRSKIGLFKKKNKIN